MRKANSRMANALGYLITQRRISSPGLNLSKGSNLPQSPNTYGHGIMTREERILQIETPRRGPHKAHQTF